MSDLKTRSMKHEMEKNHGDAAPHPLDAENVSTAQEAMPPTYAGRAGRDRCRKTSCDNESEQPEHQSKEEILDECRKSCRRNFWIELFKSAAKIAGVVLAALGLSSFNEEN